MIEHDRDDIALLLPCFQAHARYVVKALKERGFHPVVWDTIRTQAEADAFAKRGTGSKRSIHIHGAACDLICAEHKWDCHKHGCEFFSAVGEIVEDLGLCWGGRFRSVDKPHFQAIPAVPSKFQDKLRSLKTWAEKDAYVSILLPALP